MALFFIPGDDKHYANRPVVPASDLAQRLHRHVWRLAGEIGERNAGNPGSLARSAQYIEQEFRRCGLAPARHSYGKPPSDNVVAAITGMAKPEEIIVVGAHYDTVWLSPGADDNASGVAALLELACMLAPGRHDRTIRFAAFTNEEQPYAETEEMGSMVYVRDLRARKENVIAMFSLEMLGYYSDEPHSQNYPGILDWFYPDTASFIAFVSNIPSSFLLFRSLRSFKRHTDFHAEGLFMSERLLPDIRRSDHASFWDAGYQALMVTDTSFYRNPHYHTVGDLPRTLGYTRMAAVVTGLGGMLGDLARR